MKLRRSWENEPINEVELGLFWKKVQDMADKEFGVDDEGDSSVEVELVDRTRCNHMQYQPVPYGHREGMADLALEKAMYNLAVAHGAVDIEWQLHRHRKYQAEREAKGGSDGNQGV